MGTKRITIAPLDEVLKFRFDEPIARFCDTYFVEKKDARAIWKDLMRYFWLVNSVEDARHLEPERIVDEMWHTFLMYTTEYQEFGRKYFSGFLHHKPRTTKDNKEWARLTAQPGQTELREHIRKSITLVWDHLGERVALRWFVAYPKRYDAKFFDRRRPAPSMGVDLQLPPELVERAMRA